MLLEHHLQALFDTLFIMLCIDCCYPTVVSQLLSVHLHQGHALAVTDTTDSVTGQSDWSK